MTDKYIFYEFEGEKYKVPAEKQKEFESKVPTAKMMLTFEGENYRVPISDLGHFTNKVGADKITYSAFDEKKEYLPKMSTEKYAPSFEKPAVSEPDVKTQVDTTESADITPKGNGFLDKVVAANDSLMRSQLGSNLTYAQKEMDRVSATPEQVDTDMANIIVESHRGNKSRIDEYISEQDKTGYDYDPTKLTGSIPMPAIGLAHNMYTQSKKAKKTKGQDYTDALIAQRLQGKVGDKVEQYLNPSKTFITGAAEGLKDTAFDIDTWDSGMAAEDAARVYAISKKLDKGGELTDGEQMIIDSLVDDLASDMYLAARFGRGYKAGMVTGESLPFMLETMINPASKTGEAITKKFGKTIFRKIAQKVGANAARAAVYGTRVAADIAGATIMSATTSQARVAEDALNRLSGQVDFKVNEDGTLGFNGFVGGEDSAFKAYSKAFGANTIEHFSEMVGNYFAPIGSMTKTGAIKLADKIGAKKIANLMSEMTPNGFGSLLNDFAEQTQWHGMFGEFAEEIVSGAMNALVVGDQTMKKYDKDGNLNSNYLFDKENLIDTFLGVSILGGVMSTAKTVGYTTPETRYNREISRAKKNLEGRVTAQEMAQLEAFANNPFGASYANLTPFFDENKKKEDKEAVARYLSAIMQKQGYDIARDANLSGTQQGMEELRNAFVVGQNMTEADLYDVNEAEEKARQALADTGVFDLIDGATEPYLSTDVLDYSSYELFSLLQTRYLSKEEKEAIKNLAIVKNAKEGLQQKLNSVAQARVAYYEKIANSSANNGVITLGIHNGNKVYVKGDVQVSNGSIVKPSGVSGHPVEIVDSMTGEAMSVDSGEVSSVASVDVAQYNANMSNVINIGFQQSWDAWRNKKSVKSKLAEIEQLVGQSLYIDTGNGAMTEVEIQQILPNGEVVIKGKKGDLGGQSTIRVDVDSLYDSMTRDANGNPIFNQSKFRSQSAGIDAARNSMYVQGNKARDARKPQQAPATQQQQTSQTDATESEEQTATEEAPVVNTEPQDFRDYTGEILINGVPVTVYVQNQDDVADIITYTYINENGQTRSGSTTVAGFADAVRQAEEYNAEPQVDVTDDLPAIPEGGVPVVPDVSDTTTGDTETTEETTTQGENIQLTPEDIDWDALFEKNPEDFFVELQKQFGDRASGFLNMFIDAANKELEALLKKTPSGFNDIIAHDNQVASVRRRIEALTGMLERLTATEQAEVTDVAETAGATEAVAATDTESETETAETATEQETQTEQAPEATESEEDTEQDEDGLIDPNAPEIRLDNGYIMKDGRIINPTPIEMPDSPKDACRIFIAEKDGKWGYDTYVKFDNITSYGRRKGSIQKENFRYNSKEEAIKAALHYFDYIRNNHGTYKGKPHGTNGIDAFVQYVKDNYLSEESAPQTDAVPVIPVAPNPVEDPVQAAKDREKELMKLIDRRGVNKNIKRDSAFNAGKQVADMFATKEDYEAYLEVAEDLGEFLADFNRGVEASFAERNNTGNSQTNSVTLESQPNGETNGEQGAETSETGERPSSDNGRGRTDNGRGEEGVSQATEESSEYESGDRADEALEDKYPARSGDVTPKILEDVFGFKSVNASIPQGVLNTTYDMLMEMSKMLGISPKSITHGGTLELGQITNPLNNADASYASNGKYGTPVTVARINLREGRNLSGIAHEWWHSLDHVLRYWNSGIGRESATNATYKTFDGRQEVLKAIKAVLKAIKDSGHIDRVGNLNFRASDIAYLKSRTELTARAFEEYVVGKLAEAGIQIENVSKDNWVAQPTAEEMAVIAPAFDNLFKILQEKEGHKPGSSVLYQISSEMAVIDDVKRQLGQQVAEWIKQGGNFVVMDTESMQRALEDEGVIQNDKKDRTIYNNQLTDEEIQTIQNYILSLPIDHTQPVPYSLEFDGYVYIFNTDRKYFSENLEDGDGFEILHKINQLSISEDNYDVIDSRYNDRERRTISRLLHRIRDDKAGNNNGISSDSNAGGERGNAGVDGTKSGKTSSTSGGNNGSRRNSKKVQKLETSEGVIYGFVKDGVVYLDPSLINPNTSIHEYTHLWDNALMQLNPALWEKGKKLMKQTSIWNEVVNDPNYADIKDNEDLVASEVHSRLVGTKGAERLNQLEQEARAKGLTKAAKEISILGRLREWLDEATKWLKDAFSKWTQAEIDAVTLTDFLNMPLRDLANFTKIPTEGIVTNSSGDFVANNNGKGHIQLSISTWRDGGRDYLANWLAKDKTLTKDEKADILSRMDEFYENALKYTDVYVPFGTWSEAAVKYDKDGNPLMSVIKKNGDYSMNLDFSLVCKKRRPLNKLLRTLINRNAFGTYSLREREIAEINWILQEHGFEVACALCFVDSKRYRVTGVADVFAELYNNFVKALAPDGSKIAHFNYSNNPNVGAIENGIDTMPDSELNWKRFDALASQYEPNTVEGKVAKFLRNNPSQRRLVDSTDFIDANGFEAVKEGNPALLSLYNSKKGTGGPKASFGDVQYLNDILKKSRSFTAKRAYDVGGVRIQSFSDFVPHMYFDYMQLFAELSAKRLPAHAYTKEVLFAKIFGLTGLKINMSLVPSVVEGGVAPGLDADGNYAWADAIKDKDGNIIQQAQSFPYDEAMKIQNAEGYSKNCGVIAVGISDEHIEKMLDDPNIPFIIPYHKSSLNAIVARMTNIDKYKDYTNVQNTRKADGTKLDEDAKDFNLNAWLRKNPDATPQQAAQAYLDWCRENNYKPKFSQFAYHPNYFKLLVDFNTVDSRTGEYTPQGAVSMTFPTDNNEFGNVETLIQQGLKEDAELEEKMDSEIESVADEVEKRLEEIKKEPELTEKQYAERMSQLADERMAKINAKAEGVDESDGILSRSGDINPEKKDIRYRKSDIQNAAVDYLAGEERTRVIQRAVNEEAQKLGVTVTYKTRAEMPKGHETDKGYYNTKTGEIVICTENNADIADAIKTILHEAVAHKGLRKLMGARFNEFINRVYESLDAETKAKVDALAEKHYKGNKAVAMEEYMASLAETEDFAKNSVWDKIKDIFNNIINSILGRNDIKIGDNELRYILRASYNNMVNPRTMETIEGWAKDTNMRNELGINQADNQSPELMSRTGIDDIAFTTARDAYETVTFNGFTEILDSIHNATGFKAKMNEAMTGWRKVWNEWQMENQDDQQAVRTGIEAIQKETGNIPIEDFENYLLAENQMSSRSAEEIEIYLKKNFAPIVDQINDIITSVLKARGLKHKNKKLRMEVYKEVRQYLIAKHGLERNAYYQNEKGEMRDYSGLTALFGLAEDEYQNAETMAKGVVDTFEALIGDNVRDSLWNKINAATKKTLKHSYESGLLSRSQYEKIRDMFKFYIPLRGFDETTAEDVYQYGHYDGNSFQPVTKQAHGRTSVAFDPISVIMNMAASEIIHGNKNRVKQKLYNFVVNRPNTLLSIRDCWYVKDLNTGAFVEAYPDFANGETWDAFEQRMLALEATGNAKMQKKGLDIGYRFQKPENKNEHYIHLRINGVERAIFVNGNPRLAEGVNGFKNKAVILDGVKKANRWNSQLYTNYSYRFGMKNFFRDFIEAYTTAQIKEPYTYRYRFAGNWVRFNPITISALMHKYNKGTLDLTNKSHTLFKEFVENGGKTGYVFIEKLDKQKRKIDAAIERISKIGNANANPITKALILLEIIQYANECIELTARFATYATSRNTKDKDGNVRSIVKSIDDAKSVTTNFNRKGAQSGRGIIGGLAYFMGSWNLFYNASVQGVQKYKKLFDEYPLKATFHIGKWVGLGFVLPYILDIFRGDDDDEDIYWNLPEYQRKNNICIPFGNGKVTMTIPLSPTIRDGYAIGVTLNDALFSNKSIDKDATMISMECAGHLAKALFPVNPFEGFSAGLTPVENLIMFGTPDVADALAEVAINKDYKGTPIENRTTYNEGAPHYTKVIGKDNWKEKVGEKLYKLGEDNLDSSMDWNISAIEHCISSLAGGIGAIVDDVTNIVESVAGTKEPYDRLDNIPVARSLFSSNAVDDEKFVNNVYWDMQEIYKRKVKVMNEVHNLSEKKAFVDEEGNGESGLMKVYNAKAYPFLKRYYELNKELTKLQNEINEMPTGTEVEKNDKVLAEQELFNKKRDMVYELLEYEIE